MPDAPAQKLMSAIPALLAAAAVLGLVMPGALVPAIQLGLGALAAVLAGRAARRPQLQPALIPVRPSPRRRG